MDAFDGRTRDLGSGDEWGVGEESASRMVRMERTMLSWITARHRILSSRKAVGV